MYLQPKNDIEYSRKRLDAIMSRKRLKFNPYTVSDEKLLEMVYSIGWGNLFDITEMVIVNFTRLRKVNDYRKFDGIYMTIGTTSEEIFISSGALKNPITAYDTIKPERSWIGKSPIRNINDIEKLVGKRYFVSRIVRGYDIRGNGASAYKMNRLVGKTGKDAATIRQAMINAKIEMLKRILANPHSPGFLDCDKGLFDYESRINQAINLISHYHEIQAPINPPLER